MTRALVVEGVAKGSDIRNEEADVDLLGIIVLSRRLDANSRKFDDVLGEWVA
ncbi:MAG: hypothetical protein OXI01_02000 [Albidovulum sp.]|nr:hypothetical protein [Albidovulum sp.]